MIRVIGFALFFMAIGMLIMMFLPTKGWGIVLMILFLLLGYHLFCCDKKC